MKIDRIGCIPLASIPVPYKYLMGVGFYFYIKSLVEKKENVLRPKEYLLFLPAAFYGLLRLYWYVVLHSGIDRDIFYRVYQTGFFVYNDFAYLLFNLILIGFAIRFLKRNEGRIKTAIKAHKNWQWLTTFSYVYLGFVLLSLIHQITALVLNLQNSGEFYIVILVINSVYIYWIGFVGFTKSNVLFKTFSFQDDKKQLVRKESLKNRFEHYVHVERIYENKNLKIAHVSALLEVSEKELSLFIYETFETSFIDYINEQRVEKVKALLRATDKNKYTLVAIAEMCGFSSKSTFNAVFKRVTGITPSQFKKNQNK